MEDLEMTLAVTTEKRKARKGGPDTVKHLLVLMVDGKELCPLADFKGDSEADWGRKLLAKLYGTPPDLTLRARNPEDDLSALIED